MIRSAALVVVGVAALFARVAARAGGAVTPGASFQGLGQLPGGLQSYAFGVSGDGKVVVGMSVEATGVLRAFRWTAVTGVQDLGGLGGGSAEAHAASGDGSVVVGRSWDNWPGLGYHGFRGTASGGMQVLPTAEGRDVSADGSVVVGGAVWTQSGGLRPPLGPCCQSEGVSPDGGTITGWTTTSNGIRAFRWTAATGVRDLGTLGGSESAGEEVSANGAALVGQARDRNEFWRAFCWTAAAGMEELGTLGGPMSRAFGVSDNGSVIVGRSLTTSSSASETAFRWTTKNRMQDFKRELLNAGVASVQGWTLTTALRVSADSTVIVGFGLNPSRTWEAFRATLPLPR
jgi:probable HAF family extracellular repeat protein